MQPFVDAMIASPIGACMLAILEQRERPNNQPWYFDDPTSNPELVARAVENVERRSFGALCEQAVYAAHFQLGPWSPSAADAAYAAYLHVKERRPIAQAIATRFDSELHAPIDLARQEWWLHAKGAAGSAPLFQNLDEVYENGELSWRALRAYGNTSLEVLDSGFGEAPTPHTRWALPVITEPRVFEIHRPEDWHALCAAYPRVTTRLQTTWSFPVTLQERLRGFNRDLLGLPHQQAATAEIDTHLSPRWSVVATDYDAVHLSWAGFICAEGHVFTKGRNTTMLRFWDREVTMWLKNCFGTPTPMSLPKQCHYHIEATTSPARLAQDELEITKMLGR